MTQFINLITSGNLSVLIGYSWSVVFLLENKGRTIISNVPREWRI